MTTKCRHDIFPELQAAGPMALSIVNYRLAVVYSEMLFMIFIIYFSAFTGILRAIQYDFNNYKCLI